MLSSKNLAPLPKDPLIVIALSGGPDSLFLGEELFATVPAGQLFVAHFDHALRPDSSTDADFCRLWAEKKKLKFFCERWAHPAVSEEKARAARQQFLFTVRDKVKADAVALGTHADDVAETIFFRFLRGSGIAGLAGIKQFDPDIKFWRPLLSFKKVEILQQLRERKLPFVTDSTNAENTYARNFLRNEVFPLLNTRFPGFDERLNRQAEIFREAADFFRSEAKVFLDRFPVDLKAQERNIDRQAFILLPDIIQAEVVRCLFSPQAPDVAQTRELVSFLKTAASGKKTHIGNHEFHVYAQAFFVRQH